MKLFIVYVIQSEEGYRYTGMTEDMDNRLHEHNSKSEARRFIRFINHY